MPLKRRPQTPSNFDNVQAPDSGRNTSTPPPNPSAAKPMGVAGAIGYGVGKGIDTVFGEREMYRDVSNAIQDPVRRGKNTAYEQYKKSGNKADLDKAKAYEALQAIEEFIIPTSHFGVAATIAGGKAVQAGKLGPAIKTLGKYLGGKIPGGKVAGKATGAIEDLMTKASSKGKTLSKTVSASEEAIQTGKKAGLATVKDAVKGTARRVEKDPNKIKELKLVDKRRTGFKKKVSSKE